jgi:glycosyltransferase involved in cell wall biosynthesis
VTLQAHKQPQGELAAERFVLRSGSHATGVPEASIVIVTRNRVVEVQQAVQSALNQGATFETIVIDDYSDDRTVDVIAREFPAVRLYESKRPRGYIECRNFAASVAAAPIIISIDDDAYFQGRETARETVADFDSDLVGAVSIPVVDGDGEEAEDVAYAESRVAVPCFRGTAYAVRSDVFLSLGGFRALFFHQVEERDFALRLLAAGYAIRAGTAKRPIRHRVSPARDLRRLHIYSQRNVILHGTLNLPARQLPVYWAGMSVKGLLRGLRVRRPDRMVRGLTAGFAHSLRYRRLRNPVSNEAYRLGRQLYVRKAVPLSEIEPDLLRFRELRAAGSV